MTNYKKLSARRGFTLIELLIVIAILGVLAVVVLVALNPVQQLARTRDAGRISAVTQLGHAVEAYATVNNGTSVTLNNSWITALKNAGEISSVPVNQNYSAPATTGKDTPAACSGGGLGIEGGYCYNYTAGTGWVVYASLESQSYNGKCPTASDEAFAVYSGSQGRGGIVCAANYGTVLGPGAVTFIN